MIVAPDACWPWSSAASGGDRPEQACSTLVDLLCYRARSQPEGVAYVFLRDGERQEEAITYLQLERQARRIGASLQGLEVHSEAVGLLYHPGLGFIEAFFGCLFAGLVAIPVQTPPGLKRLGGLTAILSDAGTRLVLTSSDILEALHKDPSKHDWAQSLRLLATDQISVEPSPDWHPADPAVNSAAFFQYTSGTTNAPRGVVVSHANVLSNEELIRKAFRHDRTTIGIGWLPHFHDMGLIGNLLQGLYIGRPCILMSPFHFIQRPLRWLQAISHYQATTSGGPTFAYDLCVQKIGAAQRDQLDLSSWTLAFIGAETVRSATIQRFADTFSSCGFNRDAFYPCYGLAEATLFVTGSQVRQPVVVKQVSREGLMENQVVGCDVPSDQSIGIVGCGREGLDHQVLIVDPVTRVRCSADRVGEIWVKGKSVANGYRNRPQETGQIFAARLADSEVGPFLRTGDLGFIQENNLFVTGRIKDIIILHGKTHYPHEIELTVEHCADGLQAGGGAAFSLEREGREQVIMVQEVERMALRSISPSDCIEAIRTSVLSVHGVRLDAVVLIKPATIPRTTSGKVRRDHCRMEFLAGSLAVVRGWPQPGIGAE